MKRVRLCVVTGTRAEYGLLSCFLAECRRDRRVDCRLVVTGSHLERRQGMTVREIEAEGQPIHARVPISVPGDDGLSVALSMGKAVSGIARAYARLMPDWVVLLGDRFEIIAAAAAAVPMRLPIAHLYGGEKTQGAWDDSIRHAVTKLSHLHFATRPEYARRIVQLGEDPRRVHCVGPIAIDRIRHLPKLSKRQLEADLGIRLAAPIAVSTFHPVTTAPDWGVGQCRAMLATLRNFPGTVVFTAPNNDAAGRSLSALVERHCRESAGRAVLVKSLGQKRYFSLLAVADLMIGNSSSGIHEAGFFGIPVVNIGSRQKGRHRSPNVIDVEFGGGADIRRATARALTPIFRHRARRIKAPAGSPARRILNAILKIKYPQRLLEKSFSDLKSYAR